MKSENLIHSEPPRILIWDLETNGVNALYADLGFITCFGYKWMGEKETHCLTIADFPKFQKALNRMKHGDFSKKNIDDLHDDSELLDKAIEIMKQADLLVAHYGEKFDKPFLKTRLLLNKKLSLPPTKQIDTCFIGWKHLKLRSNRLKHLAEVLGCENKKQEKGGGWPNWWHRSMSGHVESIKAMADYCKQDVRTLEDIALRLRPYWPTNVSFREDNYNVICKHCLSDKVEFHGFEKTSGGKYFRYICTECFTWGKVERNLLTENNRVAKTLGRFTCTNPKCKSEKTFKNGYRSKGGKIFRKVICKDCGYQFLAESVEDK